MPFDLTVGRRIQAILDSEENTDFELAELRENRALAVGEEFYWITGMT